MTRKEKVILMVYAIGLICLVAAILTEGLAAVYMSVVGLMVTICALKAAINLGNKDKEENEHGKRKEV